MFKGYIIEQLIRERKVKKTDVYRYADIQKATLDNIIKGTNVPNCNTLEKIADFFNVSIDIFFEREKNDNTMYNGNVIKQLLLDKKVTNKELLRYLGTEANASLAQIVNGNPTVKRLEKVADFFGVSMDVFFEREKPFKAYSSAHGDNEQQYKEKIELLERLLEEKDKRILLLEQMNQLVNPTESRTDLGQTI
ncbi:helix-turn-helix domain-containing protein [Phocaeicola plebeius]|uniref:Helix-turn-helix domain-containing protein n=1 Tax=Phocaeicola plebeius TaxID=310297 RepID=A0A415J3U2_9BACT|nr:helix-turn-helix transcriptional regulator [Phocaeicola plebeius]RHK95442.1 helix-turn-helix domain-containing protein [Phocaeicola plebeius]RHL14569.1 helix-turn-helix domain-containing protein [Phocaeicola plebeius]